MKKIPCCIIAILLTSIIFVSYILYTGHQPKEIGKEIQNNDKLLIEDTWIEKFETDFIETCLLEESEDYCYCSYEQIEKEFGRDGMIVLGMFYAIDQEFLPETELRIAEAMLQCDYLLDL